MEPNKNQAAGKENYSTQKRNFSKYDSSGTDPNRYASVSNKKEAKSYLNKGNSIIPGLKVNISKVERLAMIAAGSYFLYDALKKKDKINITEGITAGAMLFRGVSGYCPAYDAIGRAKFLKGGDISINTSLTVKKPVSEVYDAWRKLENLPLFMEHLDNVTVTDKNTSEWKAKIPGGLGTTVSWTAQVLMDEPNELLSWQSKPESTINNSGKIRFKDKGNATEIDVTISYRAPLGAAGKGAAKLLSPMFEKMLLKDIENFKQYMETGDAPMP